MTAMSSSCGRVNTASMRSKCSGVALHTERVGHANTQRKHHFPGLSDFPATLENSTKFSIESNSLYLGIRALKSAKICTLKVEMMKSIQKHSSIRLDFCCQFNAVASLARTCEKLRVSCDLRVESLRPGAGRRISVFSEQYFGLIPDALSVLLREAAQRKLRACLHPAPVAAAAPDPDMIVMRSSDASVCCLGKIAQGMLSENDAAQCVSRVFSTLFL